MWTLPAVIVLAISSIQMVSAVATNGTSGQRCPRKRCLAQADCINGICICRSPSTGDRTNGNFSCPISNSVFGEIKNDPTVRNFNNELATFPFPCRYLVTSTRTILRIRKQKVGSCRCELHAWNSKYRGKFYVGGFDFTCRINNTVSNEVLEFAIRIAGQAENGVYEYTEHGANEFAPNGPWPSPPVDVVGAGIRVKSSYDFVDNRAIVRILECGWEISFVAYDIRERRDQDQIPGIAFAINCGLNPFFYDHHRVIATAPVRFGGTRFRDLITPPLTLPDTLIIRGFESQVGQTHPGGSELCSNISTILVACSPENKIRAALGCFWMFKQPRFIRCLDPEANPQSLLNLAAQCMSYFCESTVTCGEFVNRFTSTGCSSVDRIPELERIVSGDFCS